MAINKAIGIKLVTAIDELLEKVNVFLDNITTDEIHSINRKLTDLPYVDQALEEWKHVNYISLAPEKKQAFINLQDRIYKLIQEFNLTV